MKPATPKQKQIIQITCKKEYPEYSGYKDELVQWATEDVTKTSCNDLTFDQANAILIKLGKPPHHKQLNRLHYMAGQFDRANSQHMTILSLCHQLGWEYRHKNLWRNVVDVERLGSWLLSDKSPVKKSLQDMTRAECSKIITALESMTKKKYAS